MMRVLTIFLLLFIAMQRPVAAQDATWIQIEAHPSLREAQDRARLLSRQLENVHGFSLGDGWYGIMLGPYSRADARRALRIYRAEGRIPYDSFVYQGAALGRPFWPVGAAASPATPPIPQTTAPQTTAPQITAPLAAALPDETPAEARRSERLLNADERRGLQRALRAAGYYRGAIDGAFGRGTRAAMADWQAARGYAPTGILTTAQRKALMDEYNAPLISVGMRRVQDPRAGIEIAMPAGQVRFDRYEPPFAHYASTGDLGVRLILISEPGDRATLYGLYDILQTLKIVPLRGPRERGKNRFVIDGRGNGIVTHAEASLKDGEVKGFILVWPQGDEDRRRRVLAAMQASFRRIDGILDPAAGGDVAQHVDLVSGLELRKPRLSRSGFFVDGKGTVVTTTEAVQACSRVTIDSDHPAQVATLNTELGVAVLTPQAPLAPSTVARFRPGTPRLQSEVAVAGYSFEGALGAPSLTWGRLADVTGLHGETELDRLALPALPGDAGGPVLDTGGNVIGMLLPPPRGARQLPKQVRLAADAEAIRDVLAAAGLSASDAELAAAELSPDALVRRADGITVLVSCWD